MNDALHIAPLCIPHSHPALPGHFPGRPVVPGVVLLDHALACADQWLQHPVHVRALKQAKFLAPLLPQQQAVLALTLTEDELRFTIKRDDALIAQGAFELRLDRAERDPCNMKVRSGRQPAASGQSAHIRAFHPATHDPER